MKKRILAGAVACITACSTFSVLPQPMSVSSAALSGDVNADSVVNAADAKALSGWLLRGKETVSDADLNGDGRVNVFDLAQLKRTMLAGADSAYAGLVINEVCSTNKNSLKAADGTSPDWIEIFNAGDREIDLSGVGVSDGNKNRFKFTFPSGTSIPSGAYIILFCDDIDSVTGELHAAFKISAAGETIYLTAPDGSDIDTVALPELDSDITYGRYANGSSDFALLNPTPGQSNDTAELIYRVEKPLFSAEGGFYDAAFELLLSDTAGNTVYYTLDGSDPRTSATAMQYGSGIRIYDNTTDPNKLSAIQDISLRPYSAPDYAVDKGIVVRAVCKDKDGNYSAVATNNYFVGKSAAYYTDMKVLSISTDSSNFFDNATGIYMVGDQYYQWKNSGSFDPNLDLGSCDNPTNYNSEGRAWERPCNIQVFEGGELKYTEDVGVRIAGNWSTAFPQKSLTLYARTEYGSNKMQYDFFEGGATDVNGEKIKEYKKVTLRNGGNAFDNARYRDELNQSLAEGLQMGKQAKYDYIVFLDGEFWGYYAMQEKLEDNYIESHYHVDADNVTTIKVGTEYDGLASTYQEFEQFWNWAMSADMSNAANYQRVCDTLDVQGLMDFVAFQSYIVNWDCMLNNNNWMIWRADETDASNPYADGKWRFLLYDTEYSTGYDGQSSLTRNYFKYMDRSGQITSLSSLFFRLMNNASFKQGFYDTCLTVYKENFDSAKVSAQIDGYSARLKSAVSDTYRRFGVGADFDSNTKILRNFFNKRYDYALHHLNLLYGIEDGWQDDGNMIDQFGWSIWMNDGAGTISYEDDGSIRVDVTRTGQYAQVATGAVEMEAGKTYRMTYKIRTSQNVNTYTMFQEGGNDYTSYFWESKNFSPNTMTVTDTVTMSQSDSNVKYLIGLDAVGTYYISDFSMVCVN